ncbi:methionine--tRNA ligase [Candidatus Saccharibacteria bacterium]|nr:methionine--tRNA ligase [Candidatus Saccharibacteria bacterium]
MKKIYLTTAIPYVNGVPHIGHAMDYCLADVCARYFRLIGDEVRLQAGTDEHGGKIEQKAAEMGMPTQEYVDQNAEKFKQFISKLGVEYTDFVRTTDVEHEKRVQEIWQRLAEHIYKAEYEGWYCTGCERFITDKEYEENGGACPDHQKPYEKLQEENYYLRIGDFKKRISEAISSGEMVILPEFRKKEILRLLDESPDVSISRPVSQLKWGVLVPGDESQVMYVWMDALANYITVLGYPDVSIGDWWPATAQFVGKDVLRFHAIIWPAMLLGLGLELPRTIVSHGMILANGQKMSKSIGNVVDPVEVIEKYGLDAFRYYFLRHVDTFNDSDFTWEKYNQAYNNELANDLGNLIQRLAILASKNKIEGVGEDVRFELPEEYHELMEKYEFAKAFDFVWGKVQGLNKRIDEDKPWSMAKNGELEKLEKCLKGLIYDLLMVSKMLVPFLPETAEKIRLILTGEIKPPKTPLFPKD